jgi:hypothetical protein
MVMFYAQFEFYVICLELLHEAINKIFIRSKGFHCEAM